MNGWISVRVAERREEAEGIVGLVLAPLPGASLPPYEPGAHIDLKMPNGMIRQYSLCGQVDDTTVYELGILLETAGRGGSRHVHEEVKVGDVLEISAPRNLFALVPGEPALLFAGGIGITPIIAMADHLARSGTPYALHYCARTHARIAFRERIAHSHAPHHVHYHFDDVPQTRLDMARVLAEADPQAHLYACGPAGFMDFVIGAARAAGWPEARLHVEHFSAPAVQDTGDAFEIEIAGTGQIVPVASGQSAATALAEAGIEVPLSCEQGICGTCLTTVLAGVPDHRDMYLSAAEQAANDCFTPCCSRARTPRLVIEI